MTLFDEMVEAGARGADPGLWSQIDKHKFDSGWNGDTARKCREYSLAKNRAVLLAAFEKLMELGPDEEMVEAAIRAAVTHENRGVEYAPAQGLRAMLSAIIAQGRKT